MTGPWHPDDVLAPRFQWRIPEPIAIPPTVLAAAEESGLSALAVEILVSRGIVDPAAIRAYAAADPRAGLHDPHLLPDSTPTVARFLAARDRRESILVVGDFDADGLTGLAILTRALRACGLAVGTYVPDRLDEGHGLSIGAVDAAQTAGASLIITVDTGTSSLPEIAESARRGIDVIVTDHHRVGPELPVAIATVNPHRPDSSYPDRRLAGSGIALKVAQLVTAELLGMDPLLTAARLADLAVIGTVADVAPIVGENRAIARLGLERIRSAPRPGIAAMLSRAGVVPATVDLETIGFTIAPRLNAAGRVGEARDAADLLLTQDPAEAERLAEVLETANATRRDLMRTALAEARTVVEADEERAVVMVAGTWPVGIIGLVAGKLAEEHGRPAMVGCIAGDTIRASARGDGSVDLAAALDASSDLLIRHGGHRGAAGFEVAVGQWEPLRDRLATIASATTSSDERDVLAVDLALPAGAVDHRLLAALRSLEPTGPGNPAPLIAITGLTVARVRTANGGHTQLTLKRDPDVLDAIAFGRVDLADGLAVGDGVDIVARLGSRVFGGAETMQLEVQDIATSDGHPAGAALGAAIARRRAVSVAS